MAKQDSTAPIGAAERASIGRLLEAIFEALDDPRVYPTRGPELVGWLYERLPAAALAVRTGDRAHVLDKLTSQLDVFVQGLGEGGDQPCE